MNIKQQETKGVIVFTLDGRADSVGAGELTAALQGTAAEGKHKIVLDMANVHYINSAGLRTLADILTQTRNNGGDMRLVALNPKVERVFKIIGFDKFFDIYHTVEEALSGF